MEYVTTGHAANLMSKGISTRGHNNAFAAAYKRRQQAGHNSDIWSLSQQWSRIREQLQHQLLAGTCQLSPAAIYRTDAGYFSRFSSQDEVKCARFNEKSGAC